MNLSLINPFYELNNAYKEIEELKLKNEQLEIQLLLRNSESGDKNELANSDNGQNI